MFIKPHPTHTIARAHTCPKKRPYAPDLPFRQVIILELPEEKEGSGDVGHLKEQHKLAGEWRQQQQQLVSELTLLCATYAPARSAAAAASAAADPGLPPPPADVFTPWAGSSSTSTSTSRSCYDAAAEALWAALHTRVRQRPLTSRALRSAAATAAAAGPASLALMTAHEVSEQETLAACLPTLLKDRVRPIVVQRHVQSLEEGPIKPYTGPGAVGGWQVAVGGCISVDVRCQGDCSRNSVPTAFAVVTR